MARNPNRPSRRRKREGSGLGNGAGREEKSGLERDSEASGLEGTPTPDPLEHASPDIEQAELAEAGAVQADAGSALDKAEHAPPSAGGRKAGVFTFVRNCVEELRRVQWPDRRQVGQATAVVLGFVVLAGGFLGLMDTMWKPLVEAIL